MNCFFVKVGVLAITLTWEMPASFAASETPIDERYQCHLELQAIEVTTTTMSGTPSDSQSMEMSLTLHLEMNLKKSKDNHHEYEAVMHFESGFVGAKEKKHHFANKLKPCKFRIALDNEGGFIKEKGSHAFVKHIQRLNRQIPGKEKSAQTSFKKLSAEFKAEFWEALLPLIFDNLEKVGTPRTKHIPWFDGSKQSGQYLCRKDQPHLYKTTLIEKKVSIPGGSGSMLNGNAMLVRRGFFPEKCEGHFVQRITKGLGKLPGAVRTENYFNFKLNETSRPAAED